MINKRLAARQFRAGSIHLEGSCRCFAREGFHSLRQVRMGRIVGCSNKSPVTGAQPDVCIEEEITAALRSSVFQSLLAEHNARGYSHPAPSRRSNSGLDLAPSSNRHRSPGQRT